MYDGAREARRPPFGTVIHTELGIDAGDARVQEGLLLKEIEVAPGHVSEEARVAYRLKTTAGSIRTTLKMALTAATTHIPIVNTSRPHTRLNVIAMGMLSRRK
jgi:hypothetical protein